MSERERESMYVCIREIRRETELRRTPLKREKTRKTLIKSMIEGIRA